MKLYGIWLGLFVGILGTVACGGDDSDDDDDGSGGTAGSGGTSSSGGKGGTSSSGGTTSSGGSSSGGTGGTDCDPTGDMGPDTSCQAEIDCIEAECGAEAAECLGAGWSEGDFSGGSCGSTFTCANDCDCDDPECALGCLLAADADCQACLVTLNTCSTACEDEAASCE